MLPILTVSRCYLIDDNCINKNRKEFLIKLFIDTLIVKKKGVNNSSRELRNVL